MLEFVLSVVVGDDESIMVSIPKALQPDLGKSTAAIPESMGNCREIGKVRFLQIKCIYNTTSRLSISCVVSDKYLWSVHYGVGSGESTVCYFLFDL